MNSPCVTPERVRFRFQKLEVWHDARRINREAYRLSATFPREEQFALTSQVRRASVSIVANIAEGSGRNSDRDYAHYLEQAYGSAMELASHLFLARDLGYLTEDMLAPVLDAIDQTSIRIAALNRSLAVKNSKVKL